MVDRVAKAGASDECRRCAEWEKRDRVASKNRVVLLHRRKDVT